MISQTFGEGFAKEASIQEMFDRLIRIRESLAKTHYRIGFIGPTHSGKSTTMNYVLDMMDPEDQPCKEGAGGNTTSTVSRLRRGEKKIELEYLTKEELQRKRQQLCQMTGFSDSVNDEDLLRAIPKRMAEVKNGSASSLEDGSLILEHDVVLLEDLLETCRQSPSKVRPGNG